jgi:hypothetical protein
MTSRAGRPFILGSSSMKNYTCIQGLAVAAVCGVAILNVIGQIGTREGTLYARAGIGMWILFIWQLCARPKQWSLGLGILFVFMIFFQTYLWHRGVEKLLTLRQDDEYHAALMHFLPHELMLGVAAILCFLLRWWPTDDAPKTPGPGL